MNNDKRESFFINYYMSNRVMRKTHDPETLHQIYASKYANWIVPFLKQHGIVNAPSLLCCNTLAQLPDFFTLQKHSFFVSDYYLYSYFYDINYTFSDSARYEFYIDLIIKTFIELAYLTKHIDLSYSLAQNSPTIEEYKNTSDYRDRDLSVSLVEKTDLQEAFTFLHEATHFLCRRYPNLEDMEKTMSGFWNVAPLNLTSQTLEECYCDFNSVIFILKQTYPSNRLQKEKYFEDLFLTLIYTYTRQLVYYFQSICVEEYENYMDQESELLWLRFGGIHAYITKYLSSVGFADDIPLLDFVFHKSIEIFKKLGYETRRMLKYIKQEGESNLTVYANVSHKDKIAYIKYYLKLLT